MRRLILFIVFNLVVIVQSWAQVESTTSDFWNDPVNHPMMPLYALGGLIVLVVLLVLVAAIYMITIVNMLVERAARDRAEKLGIPYVPEPNFWQRMNKKLTNATPIEKEATILLDHNYDGITELDNHLPPWWKWLFYFTIAWSAVYLFVYHVIDKLPLSAEEYAISSEKIDKMKSSKLVAIDEEALVFSNDAEMINHGKEVFKTNCATCHGNEGGGQACPNLTDDYWLHGGDIKDIFKTVKNGVSGTSMIPWGNTIKPEDIRDVAFYIMSIHGTNPPGGLAPQGELYTPKAVVPKELKDSVVVEASL